MTSPNLTRMCLAKPNPLPDSAPMKQSARPSAHPIAAILVCMAAILAPIPSARAQTEQQDGLSRIVNVIELFTSQGCSSCPPADALMKTYATLPGVLVLSLPVDYWDYLGWKDTLGNSKNTDRQKNYAKARGDGQIYTPQAVINGVAHVNGASRKEIDQAITDSEKHITANRVPLRSWTERGNILIETGPAAEHATMKEATIWLAVIQKSAEVTIPSGENRGKTLTYTNVVRELTAVGTWTGQPMRIQLARAALMRPQMESVAILIQEGKAGPIIGAALTGLW
ncbi:MAG: DUF1223 domain-containing protein [Hyphomicrobiaceae bacterium]